MRFAILISALLLALPGYAAANPPAPWCMFNPCYFQYIPFHGYHVFMD